MHVSKKVYLLQHNNNTFFGYNTYQSKDILFGFRSKRTVEYVQQHLKYKPVEKMVDEVISNRYLIRTVFNKDNIFTDEQILTHIKTYSLYHSSILSAINNLTISIVDHVYDRDDGDIEIVCNSTKDLSKDIPPFKDEVIRYNLELLYKNI